jgi:hypothetical protein
MAPIGRTLVPSKARELLTNFIFIADTALVLSKRLQGGKAVDASQVRAPSAFDPTDARMIRMQTARNAIDMMARWIRRVTFSLDSLESLEQAMTSGPEDATGAAAAAAAAAADAATTAAAEEGAPVAEAAGAAKLNANVPEGPHAATIPTMDEPECVNADGSTTYLAYHAGGGLVPVRRSEGRTFHLIDASALHTRLSRVKVFLGGSCNPTTWRRDIAIPALEAAGITYYNPQVDDWSPELVEVEACAKRDATLLLFVVDAQTRAVASMNEVVEEVCRGREVALVVQDMEEGNDLTVGPGLLKDLNRGRVYLRDIAKRYGVICFSDVETAVEYVVHRMTTHL